MDPGKRRQAHITGCLGLVNRQFQGGRTSVVVTGLALRSTETRDLVRLRLLKTETSRGFRCAADVENGIVEPVLDPGEFAEHGLAANLQPRVLEHRAPSVGPDRAASTLRSWSPAEIAALAANSQVAA